jgi:hypothetical protein
MTSNLKYSFKNWVLCMIYILLFNVIQIWTLFLLKKTIIFRTKKRKNKKKKREKKLKFDKKNHFSEIQPFFRYFFS